MGFKKAIYKLAYNARENAPAIYMGLGVVGFVSTIILACHETTKAHEIMETCQGAMNEINEIKAKTTDEQYSLSDIRKDKFIVATQAGVSFIKLYSPAIIVGSLSLASFLRSYNLLKTRYLAASALAASISEAFNKYRSRVKEEYGEDVDTHLYYDTTYCESTTYDEKGKKKKETLQIVGSKDIPLYAKFFDEANRQWNKNPELNLMFLKGVENRMNDKFNEQGYLLLNQVYRALDIPETDLGCEVGWFETHGDQFIDFGIFNGSDERKRAFVNGYEPSILLCFNCVPKHTGDLPEF